MFTPTSYYLKVKDIKSDFKGNKCIVAKYSHKRLSDNYKLFNINLKTNHDECKQQN